MVKFRLCLACLFALFFTFQPLLTQALPPASQALSPSAAANPSSSAASLSPSAALSLATGTQVLQSQAAPKNPGPPPFEINSKSEDFLILSSISLPFTALYAFLAASLYGIITQQKFPPDYDQNTLIATGATALAGSLIIASVSIPWGSESKPAPKQTESKDSPTSSNPASH